jgi:hypothetical protein
MTLRSSGETLRPSREEFEEIAKPVLGNIDHRETLRGVSCVVEKFLTPEKRLHRMMFPGRTAGSGGHFVRDLQ